MAWDISKVHQDLSATGKYKANSALAKEYAGLEEDGGSRVDDGDGWREIHRDSPPKSAAEYESMVKDYAKQGFDVKAIDMDGGDFTHANFAIKPADFKEASDDTDAPVELSPRLAHARARVAQYTEDALSGQAANDLYNSEENPAEGFMERYKLKLGERLENGYYLEPDASTTNSSKVGSGVNDVSVDAAEFSRTGKDNRKDY